MAMSKDFELEENDGVINFHGELNIHNIRRATREFKKAAKENGTIDLSGLTRLDTAGALLLSNLESGNIALQNIPDEYQQLFELVEKANTGEIPKPKKLPSWVQFINRIGKASFEIAREAKDITTFLGQSLIAMIYSFTHPHKMRWGSIVHHVEAIGIRAIPIVSVMAFAIAVILAYQGVAQLRPLGAEQFTANLITISVLREMGVLLTAIMVAGRSGSAFTAEIGVMKLREETDALRASGLDVFQMLVVPRLIAIVIALPLLTFIADIMGLLGGAVMTGNLIGTSFQEYMDQVERIATVKIFLVGLVKAPVFALAIGIIGCLHGLKVSGSSESVGKETTSSVVKAIFLVLILDALFSVLFQKMGI